MRTIVTVATLVALALPPTAWAQSGDAFLCYGTHNSRGATRFVGRAGLPVADRFGIRLADIRTPRQLCAPAAIDGGSVGDPTTHLLIYPQTSVPPAPTARAALRLQMSIGTLSVDLLEAERLGAPAATDPVGTPSEPDPDAHDVNHYQCWQARPTPGTQGLPKGLTVTVDDTLGGPRSYRLGRLRHVCTPARSDGADVERAAASLACFAARGPRSRPELPRGLHVRDDVATTHVLDLTRGDTLCLPAILDDGRCNGDAALCDRRYDEVAYATTHNAMSNFDEGWLLANQQHGITRQLDDGIHGLMLDTHYDQGVAHLCHSLCQIGKEPLVSGLLKVRRWLDLHPQDVVTIIFEAYISEGDTEAAFAAAGLLPMVHVQPVAASWPTLAQLIATEKRLVVFTDERGVLPWHHYVWDYASETPFSFETPAQLSCAPNRGNPSNPLFILNHFLTQVVGRPELAEQINHDPLFVERALACQDARDRLPNFVTVDFYDVGDVFSVTAVLNGLAP